MDVIFPVQTSIHSQIHPAAKFAFQPDFSVGVLIIAATGTRLKTMTLISANQNSQKSLNASPGLSISSTIILSSHMVMECFPLMMSMRYLLKSLSLTVFFQIET